MTTKKNKQTGAGSSKRGQAGSSTHARASAQTPSSKLKQYALTAGIGIAAFFGAYAVSHAVNRTPVAPTPVAASTAAAPTAPAVAPAAAPAAAVAPATEAPAEQAAATEGGVQKIAVKVGFDYTPSVIHLKAGVPAEITFGAAQGCTSLVQSSDLGFQEDLSTGAKTVKLKALQPGTYGFACGMNMVRGQIVVS